MKTKEEIEAIPGIIIHKRDKNDYPLNYSHPNLFEPLATKTKEELILETLQRLESK